MVWRAVLPFLRSRKDRMARKAAAMTRRHWREDAPRSSRLRRAVDHAVGAVYAALLPRLRALSVLRRTLSVLQRALSISLQRALAFLPSPRRLCQGQRAGRTPPPPPPPPPPPQQQQHQQPRRNACAAMYGDGGRRRRPTHAASSASSSASSSSSAPEAYTVDGEDVPQDVVSLYKDYCRRARACHANSMERTCHFCVLEGKRVDHYTVKTSDVFWHCSKRHARKNEYSVPCNKKGCNVRTRPGRDQALHLHFCHTLQPGWWE